jgi:hypothetical protein
MAAKACFLVPLHVSYEFVSEVYRGGGGGGGGGGSSSSSSSSSSSNE